MSYVQGEGVVKLIGLARLFGVDRTRTKTYATTKMSNDFFVRQSEGYEFIQNTAEHVRIATHGTEEERAAAVARYIEACRLNYMSVSEASAWWRFLAPTEEMYQACLPIIRDTAAAAAEEEEPEPEPEPEDDVEALVLERYGALGCTACGLPYSIFSSSEPEPEPEPCALCSPQYHVDYRNSMLHIENAQCQMSEYPMFLEHQ